MLSLRCASFFAGKRWLTVFGQDEGASGSSGLESGPSGPSVLTSFSTSEDLDELCEGTATSSSPARSPLLSSTCYLSPSKGLVRGSRPSFGSFSDLPDITSITRSQSLDNILEMISKTEKAVAEDTFPELSVEGTGGTYFVKASDDDANTRIGVFKPSDEEVSLEGNPRGNNELLKSCIPSGDSWKREIAAYRLDHGHFAGVPETIQLRMPKHYFQSKADKVGSFQRFVPSDAESWDVMPACLPTESIHRIAILDIRMCNSDRHGGNVLVCRADGVVSDLVPIDHGCCFPTDLTELEFEWLLWKQSKSSFSTACLNYIASLNGARDASIVENELGIDHAAASLVRAATLFLQTAALTYQLTAYDIGTAMRRPSIGEPSPFELAVADSRCPLAEGAELDFDDLGKRLQSLSRSIAAEKQ